MARDNPSGEDPIIAALPPETDYITYLTILEYNLTPKKLPTINHLLESDDGSLAENIGWDLLSIVLPMLNDAPDEATKCLEIVSTRANPREVVIQVAGELEKLGIDEDEQDEDDVVEEDEDDLRTFEGEAERIHLGRLDFNDVPPSRPEASDHPSHTTKEPAQDTVRTIVRESKFSALLQMLGILHPRIKTQHPSRFLATSLTAALRASRNIPTTSTSTKAFVDLLRTLQKAQEATPAPPLPPRRGGWPGLLREEEFEQEKLTSRDPAISRRLLQAVTLEVLEYYVLSFRAHHDSDMAWTTRLRERLERKRALLGRSLETERWSSVPELEMRDGMLADFVSLAQDLDLEREVYLSIGDLDPFGRIEGPPLPITELESDTEYPTSPEQIPLSIPALVYLHAFAEFRRSLNAEETGHFMRLTHVARLSLYLQNPNQQTQHEQSTDTQPQSLPAPTVDAVLTLLYLQLTKISMRRDIHRLGDITRRCLLGLLVEIFTSSPDANIRDSAHHIAGVLLHNNLNKAERSLTIQKVLQMSVYQDRPGRTLLEAASSVPNTLSANLRSVGVDWLKEEIVYNIQGATPHGPCPPDDIVIKGLDPLLVLNDASDGLRPLLFPIIPAPPGVPLTTSTTTEEPTATPQEDNHEAHIHDFLSNLSFYISTLNLLYIFLSLVYIKRSDLHTPIEDVVKERLRAFAPWRRALLDFMGQAQPDKGSDKYHDGHEGTGDNQQVLESMGEVWAFDDAMDRLERVFEKRQKERPDGTELGRFKD